MRYLLTLIISISGFIITSPVQAETCFIADPKDTALNVRATPNGEIINRLRNGREVEIERYQDDTKGRPWGYATGEYKGKHRKWGWVFMEAVNCGEKSSAGSGTAAVITPSIEKVGFSISTYDKIFKKALTKKRKLPRHNKNFLLNDEIIHILLPSMNWNSGALALTNIMLGIFYPCKKTNKTCFYPASYNTIYHDNTPDSGWSRVNANMSDSSTIFVEHENTIRSTVEEILHRKKVIGALFTNPDIPSQILKVNSDLTIESFHNGKREFIGWWYQTDVQKEAGSKRWRKMHKKMRRYSASAKDERRRKVGRLLGTIAKVGIAAARGYNSGNNNSANQSDTKGSSQHCHEANQFYPAECHSGHLH